MELTIGRPCSGKHVIAVIGCVKAARWRLCDEKGVRIATVSDLCQRLVNCREIDVGVMFFI